MPSRQRAEACAQRSANAQCSGKRARSGTWPGMEYRRRSRWPGTGREAI
ncbi:hypothetical protein BLA29_015534, partial [Euroglyphus maynei]